MVYTFFFHVMVTTILMNIIFGIIIDTFAELREKEQETEQEIQGRCFICGIERFRFDQVSCSLERKSLTFIFVTGFPV